MGISFQMWRHQGLAVVAGGIENGRLIFMTGYSQLGLVEIRCLMLNQIHRLRIQVLLVSLNCTFVDLNLSPYIDATLSERFKI